jgi:hypothetical protein
MQFSCDSANMTTGATKRPRPDPRQYGLPSLNFGSEQVEQLVGGKSRLPQNGSESAGR